MSDEKKQCLAGLADIRRQSKWVGYSNVADFHEGAYDCRHVSPYTKSAGNVDSPIFILLQDWVSEQYLRRPLMPALVELGRNPALPTNQNLDRLVGKHFGLTTGDLYATNLFPFIKPGDMSAKISAGDLVRAARIFAWPQIEIVRPRLVVALGLDTFNALRGALGLDVMRRMADAIGTPFDHGTARVWCQAHTGEYGQRNRNSVSAEQVDDDWQEMSAWFKASEE